MFTNQKSLDTKYEAKNMCFSFFKCFYVFQRQSFFSVQKSIQPYGESKLQLTKVVTGLSLTTGTLSRISDHSLDLYILLA